MAALKRTLTDAFGFDDFRGLQEEVVHAVLFGRRDVAVVWATGAGKSLVYQLPALHTGKTAVVVSPLISLMSDQVRKLNATVGASRGRDLAAFLGSAQTDWSVEARALEGDFAVLYVTPEKLGFGPTLERLAGLHRRKGLSLVAIDEAHCVSEWGHSFRKDYRDLGRVRDALPDVPMVALTATATARVRDDVISSLRLRSPLVSHASADRPNLAIEMAPRDSFVAGIDKVAAIAAAAASSPAGAGSMIVYCATIRSVEEVTTALRNKLTPMAQQLQRPELATVAMYHGKMPQPARERSHSEFLTGAAPSIVATTAFGMGIDKADIRAVVNWEAPKTVEEYWQMIGRAGRDGLKARCLMLWTGADFARYGSDFYTEGLSEQAAAAVAASTAELRRITEDERGCRRAGLLRFFGETEPPFGKRCGTCDACEARQKRLADQRARVAAGGRGGGDGAVVDDDGDELWDAGPVVMLVLAVVEVALNATRRPALAMTNLFKSGLSSPTPKVAMLKAKAPRRLTAETQLKEFVKLMVGKGLLQRQTVKGEYQAYDTYRLTPAGRSMLARGGTPKLLIPKPRCVVEDEAAAAAKRAALTKELSEYGVAIDSIPEEQLASQHGPVLTAQLEWSRRLGLYRSRGQEERAAQLELLLAKILAWRARTAQELNLSPVAVLPDYLAKNIAYSCPTSEEALLQLGVRVKGIGDLAALLKQESDARGNRQAGSAAAAAGGEGCSGGGEAGAWRQKRQLPWRHFSLPTGLYTAPKPWPPVLGKKAMTWEKYYDLAQTMKIEVIAARGELTKGKPVKPDTVVGHMITAMLCGRPVDLRTAVAAVGGVRMLPNKDEWEQLEEGAALLKLDPVIVDVFDMKPLIAKMLNLPSAEHLPERGSPGSEEVGPWYEKIRWWAALKRGGVPVKFE